MKIKITCRSQQSLWLKKNISKALAFGLLLNNICSSSNANNVEIPNRYQTLEGEYITIDDSTQGELREIEIFGNTVQDENDSNNIQSVGDLYVDKSGNPILDGQGKKQYQIKINSCVPRYQNQLEGPNISENPFPYSKVDGEWNEFEWNIGDYIVSQKYAYDDKARETYNGDKIYVRFNIVKLSDVRYNSGMFSHRGGGHAMHYMYPEEYNALTVNTEYMHSKIVSYYGPDNYAPLNLAFGNHDRNIECKFKIKEPVLINLTQMYGKGNEPSQEWCDENIPYTTDNEVYYEVRDTVTILLPTQLQKVGNIADRLYWDNNKKKYVVEKNIWYNHMDESDQYSSYHLNNFTVRSNPQQHSQSKFIISGNDGFINSIGNYGSIDWAYVNCNEEYLNSNGISGDSGDLAQYAISKGNYGYYYRLNTPQIIETNIISKIRIPTYDSKTHICVDSENGVNPTLKVTVDRLSQVAKNAIEEAKINPTTENISLARIYINMLPESTYKDQLQEQLSEVFNSEITLDKKTASANLDIYIKSENMLSMSLDTNSVTFDNYSGIDELEKNNAVEISINSSLPYSLNAYLLDEMYNSDKSKKIDMDRLQIKDNADTDYKEFTAINEKLVLKDSCESGNDKVHNIDLKLQGGNAHKADIYKTVIKFEAEQK